MSLLEHLRSASRTPPTEAAPAEARHIAGNGQVAGISEVYVAPVPAPPPDSPRLRVPARNEALIDLKGRVHEELIHELDPTQLADDVSYLSPARRAVEQAADERLAQIDATLGRQD